jgi:branched-subunit amino acid aminotransferase/4-amino-4-deoxychorismate lyase
MDAEEAFCAGTAVGVAPVATITHIRIATVRIEKELLKARAWMLVLYI